MGSDSCANVATWQTPISIFAFNPREITAWNGENITLWKQFSYSAHNRTYLRTLLHHHIFHRTLDNLQVHFARAPPIFYALTKARAQGVLQEVSVEVAKGGDARALAAALNGLVSGEVSYEIMKLQSLIFLLLLP